jgi:hypothetical protein
VRSVTFASPGPCEVSFVVGPTGWLRTQSFSATDEARVYLQNGNITAPLLDFDGMSYLGGAGTISGKVVLRGDSVLFAGTVYIGGGCWAGRTEIENGVLNIDTLRVGPATIEGGYTVGILSPVPPPFNTSVVLGRLEVAAGTNTNIVFLLPGLFVTFNEVEVSARVVRLHVLTQRAYSVFGKPYAGQGTDFSRQKVCHHLDGRPQRSLAGPSFLSATGLSGSAVAGRRLCHVFVQQL